jgi:SpoIIAA-like
MAVELQEEANGKVLTVNLSGKLTKEDYKQFVPEIERMIDQHGKIRILVRMHDFHGWSAGALWEDLKFDWKHFSHIERLALVGEKRWEKGMAAFCRPFTKATIRYFDEAEAAGASDWIREGLPVEAARVPAHS